MIKNSPAILVAADRLSYFTQTLRSVVDNIGERKLIISIDLCSSAAQTAIAAVAEKLAPQAEVRKANVRLGCGRHMIEARDVVLADAPFGHILEDDLVLSEGHFDLVEDLYGWACTHYTNVGVAQAWNTFFLDPEGKELRKDEVQETYCHWWGYLLSQETWRRSRELCMTHFHEYLKTLDSYGDRDPAYLNRWARELLADAPGDPPGAFPQNSLERSRVYSPDQFLFSSQDAITCLSLFLQGKCKVAPVAGRGQYLGEVGVHFTPSFYQYLRLGEMNFSRKDDRSGRQWRASTT